MCQDWQKLSDLKLLVYSTYINQKIVDEHLNIFVQYA